MAPRRDERGKGRRDRSGKHDVELAKVHRSLEVRRVLAYGFVGALWIAACSIPIWALRSVIEPLAGRETIVEANVVISASLTISVVLNGLQYLKTRSQRSEIQRLRRRVTELEDKLLE